MINGAHIIIYSKNPEADRDFFRDVLKFPHVDAGQGWLIFGLPPSEVAVHPSEKNNVHEFYLMCPDATALAAALLKKGVPCSPLMNRGWGLLINITLPGGGTIGIYEPRHARPKSMVVPKERPKAARPQARTAVRKAATKPRTRRS
jgi:hypothetical protein